MKFIADSMLGRLARWLRLIGYDTLYYPHIEDSLILRIAREEDRTLLTRDTRLVKVRGLKDFLLLKENDPFDQLKSVILTFSLISHGTPEKSLNIQELCRCSLCNQVLDSVPKEDAKMHVPEYVFQTSESFKHCKKCGRFYWKGTHHALLQKKLAEIL
jgi:uncharacterized protein with PIN domain